MQPLPAAVPFEPGTGRRTAPDAQHGNPTPPEVLDEGLERGCSAAAGWPRDE
jgi:hypothetical protein